MSCFVISKSEYIKAAGLIAGLAEASSKSHANRFWLYNFKDNRNYTTDDYYKTFCKCFEYNALSVQQQYKDEQPELDDNEYKDVFKEYINKGKRLFIYKGSQDTKNAVINLKRFFDSCIYQTEEETYSTKMRYFFNQILVNLMEYAITTNEDSVTSWGTLDI